MTTSIDHDMVPATHDGVEPEMVDQRMFEQALRWYFGVNSTMALAAVEQLPGANIGIPFTFVHERRWNEAGEEIGPILKVDERFAEMIEEIIEASKWASLRVVARWRRSGVGVPR